MRTGWVAISRQIMDAQFNGRSQVMARYTLVHLASLGAVIRCTMRELSAELDMAPRQVARLLQNLEKGGHVVVKGEGAVRTIHVVSDLVATSGEWRGGGTAYCEDMGYRLPNEGGGLWRGAGLSPATRNAVFERDGSVCRWCGDTAGPFHIDHVTPVAMGGSDKPGNLCVACKSCNLSKGAKHIKRWRAARRNTEAE